MLDPAHALNVATSVLQFLDFTIDCIDNRANNVDPDNTTQRLGDIDLEIKRLKEDGSSHDVASDQVSVKSDPDVKQTEAEIGVQKIYEKCVAFADKLSGAVQKAVSPNNNEINSKADGRGGELEKLKKEAESLRTDTARQTLLLLNDRRSTAIRKLDELRKCDAQMEANLSRRFEVLRQEVSDALDQKGDKSKTAKSLSALLKAMLEEARHVSRVQDILMSIRFEGMASRKQTIASTHADTYEWIFSSSKALRQKGVKANFPAWLDSGTGIFWITGHPGSGKSTLMKFIDNHATTIEKLKKWATGFRLVKASHYFWVNGNTLQKSQAGLLRALCFDIMRQCPDLVPQLCEERWNEGHQRVDTHPAWTVAELERILHQLQTSELKVKDEHARFCLFVDGLDEYSGDYDELLDNLRQLATSPHIKICAASRPWNLFEEALGQDPSRVLTMQDLTNEDMTIYVRDLLEEDENFKSLVSKDPKAENLIDQITERAGGVFLWVHLVVPQIQRSLQKGTTVDALEKKLNEFPSNLDDYFRHMLDTMDVFYQRETAQVFRVCIRARQPLALLGFCVLDPENPVSIRISDDKPTEQSDIDEIHKKMDGQIYLRGPDLLQVVRDGKYLHVTFTHRSVRDFLTHNNMDTLFAERAGGDFNPFETLCSMSIITLRYLSMLLQGGAAKALFYALVDDILDYAYDMELADSASPHAQLNRLEEILENEKQLTTQLNTNQKSPLLPLAIRRNLCQFIKQRAAMGPGTLQPVCQYPDRPLLSFALPDFQLRSERPAEFRPDMVRILLQNGSDPNTMSWYKDEEANVERRGTVWSLYLRALHSLHKRPKTRLHGPLPLLVTEAIIESGAKYLPACLTEDGNRSEREILEFVFGKTEASRLLSLRAQPTKSSRTTSGTATRPAWARAASSKLRRLSLGGESAVS